MASIKLKGDTSGEVTISAPAVAGTTTLTLPATSSTLATQNALGVRNLIINGDMRIAQRGTSVAGITTAGYYTVDRFTLLATTAGTWTQTQDTDVPTGQGFSKSFKMQCTTANASLSSTSVLFVRHRIEAQNLQHIKKGTASAESLTYSFWVKSNKTGTYIAEIFDDDNVRQISKAYTINAADTWEKKVITFAGDTSGSLPDDNGSGFSVALWFVAGTDYTSNGTLNTSWQSTNVSQRAVGQVNLADSTSNYINITGVQLEIGDTATPFEHRPYDMELARCQRYYLEYSTTSIGAYGGIGIASAASGGTAARFRGANFLTPMRATPTLTISGSPRIEYGAASTIALSNNKCTIYSFGADVTVSPSITAGYCYSGDIGANGKLTFSAEL